jgi:hypothetical protein
MPPEMRSSRVPRRRHPSAATESSGSCSIPRRMCARRSRLPALHPLSARHADRRRRAHQRRCRWLARLLRCEELPCSFVTRDVTTHPPYSSECSVWNSTRETSRAAHIVDLSIAAIVRPEGAERREHVDRFRPCSPFPASCSLKGTVEAPRMSDTGPWSAGGVESWRAPAFAQPRSLLDRHLSALRRRILIASETAKAWGAADLAAGRNDFSRKRKALRCIMCVALIGQPPGIESAAVV